jgi:hypothetical protein
MNKDYIYKRRLLKLANLLDTLPEERFCYKRWVGFDWEGKSNLSCGTTACAFGWATTISSFRKLGLRLRQIPVGAYIVAMKDDIFTKDFSYYRTYTVPAANKIFDLTHDETDWLFLPKSHRTYRKEEGPDEAAPPQEVAKHIRDFVKEKYGN